MPEDQSRSSYSKKLEDMFVEAIEAANEADVDEPPLVWPKLPENLRANDPEQKES